MSDDEVTVMIVQSGRGTIDMAITHDESGKRVQGVGNKRHQLYQELMDQLEFLVETGGD